MIKMIFVHRAEFGPDGGIDPDRKFHLAGVSPSWLMPAAYHGIGHGGPGSKPGAAAPSDGDWDFRFDRNSELAAVGGDGALVLILDTFRTREELEAASAKYQAASKPQKLLISLLKPGQMAEFIPASPSDLAALGDLGAGPERYRMSDHGIFAAGIIHSIAPNASLHLYEVLNEYGVGSLESIAKGLRYAEKLRTENAGQRIFVNCSLMLSAPATEHGAQEYPAEFRDVAIFDYMNQSFGDIVAQLTSGVDPITIVAAAGNDRKQGAARPAVRYPAAFPGVISVGAVTDKTPANNTIDWTTASYSNHSDGNGKDGYLTFGGEPSAGKGVLGIYIEDSFPGALRADRDSLPENVDAHDYLVANETGWAWWAGTSFATPIIAGLLARTPVKLHIGSNDFTENVDKLDELAKKTVGKQPLKEHVIFARQGSSSVIA